MIENVVGAVIGIKLVNGKFKPKFGAKAIIALIFLGLLTLGIAGLLVYGLIEMNFEHIIIAIIGLAGMGYIFMISPYTQKSSNYYIEFQNENTLEGFKLSYKNKLVNIKHKIDKEGKIAFANNESKLSCISYADGSKMSNFVKYRIINYFTKWLNDNNLLSSETTVTFEEL